MDLSDLEYSVTTSKIIHRKKRKMMLYGWGKDAKGTQQ